MNKLFLCLILQIILFTKTIAQHKHNDYIDFLDTYRSMMAGAVIGNYSTPDFFIKNYLFPAPCYEVSNITFEGNSKGMGHFTNGLDATGFDKGMVLSTGDIVHLGYQSSHPCGLQLRNGAANRNHPELGFMVYPIIVEFDVKAFSQKLVFEYIYGSEEYCEYLESVNYSAFALYVSGPGINGNPNFAKIPGTNMNITAKNINHNVNNQFYFSNLHPSTKLSTSKPCQGHPTIANTPNPAASTSGFVYDGFSKDLKVEIDITPCKTYHVKMIFTNINGVSEPAGVLIKKNECVENGSAKLFNDKDFGSSLVMEGCQNAKLRVFRPASSDITKPYVFNYKVANSSTATKDDDYSASLPGTVTIPAGASYVDIPISIIDDGLAEGSEELIIEYSNANSCAQNGVAQTKLTILDKVEMQVFAEDITACADNVPINIAVNGGVQPLKYYWNTGQQGASITALATVAGSNYTVTVVDACGNSKTTSLKAYKIFSATANMSSKSSIICGKRKQVPIILTFTGQAPWTYQYSINGITQPIVTTYKNPDTLLALKEGVYNLLSLNGGNCSSVEGGVEITKETILANAGVDKILNCYNSYVYIGGNSSWGTQFNYQWSNGSKDYSFAIYTPGTYILTVSNTQNDCISIDTVVVTQDLKNPSAFAESKGYLNCYNNALIVNGIGTGSGNLLYNWSNGATTPQMKAEQPGIYTLTVTDIKNGCISTDTVLVKGDKTIPTIQLNVSNNIDCIHDYAFINAELSNISNNRTFSWLGGTNYIPIDSFNIKALYPGAYSLTVTNITNGCTSEKIAFVGNYKEPPKIEKLSNKLLNCVNPNVTIGEGTEYSDYKYTWTTLDGNIVSGNNSLIATVNKVGVYILTVENKNTGCINSSSVTVTENLDIPKAAIDKANEITCKNPIQVLNGTSSWGTNLSYEWSSPNGGQISGNRFQAKVNITKGGIFILKVTNTQSLCTSIAQITVEDIREFPMVNIANPDIITCKNSQILLNANNSSLGSNFTYSWATNGGNIISGKNTLSPIVDQQGSYTLKIKNVLTDCESEKSIFVPQNKVFPVANAGPTQEISCSKAIVQLKGTGSVGANFSYNWTSTNGTVTSGANSLSATTNQEGVYTLVVTDKINGCSSTSSVTVTKSIDLPKATAGNNKILSCSNNTVMLDATGSSQGSNFTFQWTTTNGNFVAGQNSLTPTVNKAGIYRLVIVNMNTNCRAFSNVVVTEDKILPTLKIVQPDIINCQRNSLTFNTLGSSSGANFKYKWTTPNGIISSSDTLPFITIIKGGIYNLKIINTINNCSKDTSINVLENKNKPIINFKQPDLLSCKLNEVVIDASQSVQNANAISFWTTNSGHILSGQGSLKTIVNQVGTYQLTLIDTLSLCSETKSINIEQNKNAPSAKIEPLELNCKNLVANIQSNVISANPVKLNWTTQDGHIINGSNTANPTIDKVGTYKLVLTDTIFGCTTEYYAQVKGDFQKPSIVFVPNDIITCKNKSSRLQLDSVSIANNFEYQWSNGDKSVQSEVNKSGIYYVKISNLDNGCESLDSIQVNSDIIKPDIILANVDTLTCLKNSVMLSAKIEKVNLYRLAWKSSFGIDSTISIIAQSAGIYQLEVENIINGCKAKKEVEVIENKLNPDFNIEGNTILNCKDSILNLKVNSQSSNLKYEWNGNPLSSNLTIYQSGIYNIKATDIKNGCFAYKSITINEDKINPLFFIPTPDELTCKHTEVNIAAISSQNDLVYNWIIPNGTIIGNKNSIKTSQKGNYKITAMNPLNFCTSTMNISIVENKELPKFNAGEDVFLNCKQQTLQLKASILSLDVTLNWSGIGLVKDVNTNSPTINQVGCYILRVTREDNGCEAVDSVCVRSVSHPLLKIQSFGNLTCIEKNILLSAEGSSQGNNIQYLWKQQNTFLSNSKNIIINQPGDYIFKIIDTLTGCEKDTLLKIKENKTLPIIKIAQASTLNCHTNSVIIDASSSSNGSHFSYIWQGQNIISGQQTLQAKVAQEGKYVLKIIDNINGCETSDSVIIKRRLPKVNISTESPPCYGQKGKIEFSDAFDGIAPYRYSINNGLEFSAKMVFPNLVAGTYQVAMKDAEDCEVKKEVTLIEPAIFKLKIEPKIALKLGDSYPIQVEVEPIKSHLSKIFWTPTEFLSCSDCLEPTIIKPTRGGFYELQVQNDKGCKAKAEFLMTLNRDVNIYAPNIFTPNGDNFNDGFTLFANKDIVLNINVLQIYNRWGALLFENKNISVNDMSNGWDGTFNNERQLPGIYVWRAEVLLYDGTIKQLSGDLMLE